VCLMKWQNIPGYEGLYQVSSNGDIKSLCRRPGVMGHIRKTFLDSEGYPQILLTKNGISRKYRVHNLVLLTFRGPRPVGCQCLHNDGDRRNVGLDNLRLWYYQLGLFG